MKISRLSNYSAALIFFISFMLSISEFSSELRAFPVERSDVRRQLILGGEQRQKAIWYIYQLQYNDLLRNAVMYLFKSDNYDDHRAVLRVMNAYGDDLENYLPDWYVILDQYMNDNLPEDILTECFNLIVFWQEQRMLNTMIHFSMHPTMNVRFSLFQALSRMGNDLMMPVFIRLFNGDRSIYKMYALEATARYYDTRLLPFMVKLMDDENKSVRIYALEALSRRPEMTDQILRRFSLDSNNEVRARVVEIVARNNWRQHNYIIHRGITDSSPAVRTAAFQSAKTLLDSASSLYISNQLESESDAGLKNQGMDILMLLKNGGGGRGISRILLEDEDESIRLKAAISAGVTLEQGSAKALIESLERESSKKIRLEIAHSMGLLKNRTFLPSLLDLLQNKDENADIRTQALISMLEIDRRQGMLHLSEIKNRIEDPILLKQIEAIFRKESN